MVQLGAVTNTRELDSGGKNKLALEREYDSTEPDTVIQIRRLYKKLDAKLKPLQTPKA